MRDDVLDALLLEPERVAAHDGRVDEEEAQRVGAVLVEDHVGVRVVAQRLGHLLAVGGEDVAAHDEVLPRRRVEEVRRQHEERVEPAARLVHRLGDEVGRERLLELLLVLERVVDLGVGHAARARASRRASQPRAIVDDDDDEHAETGTTHLPDSNQQSKTSSTRLRSPLPFLLGIVMWSILSRWRSVMPVTPDSSSSSATDEMQTICVRARRVLERGEREGGEARAHLLVVLARPERQGRAPVPVAADVPVARVLEPVLEPVLADRGRDPARRLVVLDELVLVGLDAHEPDGDGAVDEGRARAAREEGESQSRSNERRQGEGEGGRTASRRGTSG